MPRAAQAMLVATIGKNGWKLESMRRNPMVRAAAAAAAALPGQPNGARAQLGPSALTLVNMGARDTALIEGPSARARANAVRVQTLLRAAQTANGGA